MNTKKATIKPTQIVTVKAGGKSYSEFLRSVKEGVGVDEVDGVLSMRKGMGYKLQKQVRQGERAEALKKVICDKVSGVQVGEGGKGASQMVFTIKGLDEEATAEAVKQELLKEIGGDADDIHLLELRRAFGRTECDSKGPKVNGA